MNHSQINNKIVIHSNILKDFSQLRLNILHNTLKFCSHNNLLTEKRIINEQLNLYKLSVNRILNLNFDNQNINTYEIKPKDLKIEYIKNDYETKFLNNQQKFKDISIIQVLKILREKHKINNFEFKECIKINKDNLYYKELLKGYALNVLFDNIKYNSNDCKLLYKKFPEKIIGLLNSYYGTIKTNTTLNTIKKLKQKENNKPFIYCFKDGIKYKVYLKKTFKLSHSFKNDLYSYQSFNNKDIETEFNIKFNLDNQFKTIYTD